MIALNGLMRERRGGVRRAAACSTSTPSRHAAGAAVPGSPGDLGGSTGLPRPSALLELLEVVERYRVTTMSAVPTIYSALAERPVDADISAFATPSVGASPLPHAVRDGFESATGMPAGRGLRAHRGHLRERDELPGTAPSRGPSASGCPTSTSRPSRSLPTASGSTCPPARSGSWPSADRPSFPATSWTGVPNGPVLDGLGKLRDGLAGHRRPGQGRRRRLRPPDRPCQGPDHPGRSQHRSAVIENALLAHPASPTPRRWVARTSTPVRCRSRSSPSLPGPRRAPRSCAPGRPSTCPNRPPRPRPSPCWTRSRSPRRQAVQARTARRGDP